MRIPLSIDFLRFTVFRFSASKWIGRKWLNGGVRSTTALLPKISGQAFFSVFCQVAETLWLFSSESVLRIRNSYLESLWMLVVVARLCVMVGAAVTDRALGQSSPGGPVPQAAAWVAWAHAAKPLI